MATRQRKPVWYARCEVTEYAEHDIALFSTWSKGLRWIKEQASQYGQVLKRERIKELREDGYTSVEIERESNAINAQYILRQEPIQ